MKREEAIKQLGSKCEVCGSTEALQLCGKEPRYHAYQGVEDLTKFRLLCAVHGIEYRAYKRRKSKGKDKTKITTSIAVDSDNWENFRNLVDVLKKRGMVSSLSDIVNDLVHHFVEVTNQWMKEDEEEKK